MEVTGVNGQLQIDGNKIVIKRKGILAKMSQGLKGDKEILIKHLSSIQFLLEHLQMVISNSLFWRERR